MARLQGLQPRVAKLEQRTLPAASTGDQRVRGRALQAIRDRHRRLNPLCVHCDARGIVRAWTQLDHLVALENGGTETDDNRQGLCDECHAVKTQQDNAQARCGGVATLAPPVGRSQR